MNIIEEIKTAFSKDFRRTKRRELTQFILGLLKHTKMPPHVLEFVIKSTHFQHIFLSYLSLFLVPKTFFLQMTFISFSLFVLFFYLDGCVLSNVEYKLCKNKSKFINIIDPFLYSIGKEINTDNRYYYTLYMSLFYFVGCLIKFIAIFV